MSLDNFADGVLPPLERLREDQTAFRITGSDHSWKRQAALRLLSS
jgi:hypothetical protein